MDSHLVPEKVVQNDVELPKIRMKINTILNQYEYEIYRQNFDYDPDDASFRSILTLKPYELWDLLQINSDGSDDFEEQNKIIRYLVKGKMKACFAAASSVGVSQKLDVPQLDDRNRLGLENSDGIWQSDGHLVYGLWHNSLFMKFKRSSVSHLYDRLGQVANRFGGDNVHQLLVDLDQSASLSYVRTRILAMQIRHLISYNKYHAREPYRIELMMSKFSESLDSIFSRSLPSIWNSESKPFVSRIDVLKRYHPKRLLYILPSAKRVVSVDELADPSNILVLPGYSSSDLRDPFFAKLDMKCQARRLPTTEHIVWNGHHGVLPMSTTFAICHDMAYGKGVDNVSQLWTQTLKKHIHPILVKDDHQMRSEQAQQKLISAKRKQAIQEQKHNHQKRSSAKKVEKYEHFI